MLAALVFALFVQDAPPAEGPPPPAVLPSRIAEVVVHRTLARVTRTADVPGEGRFVVEGLPGIVNPETVRVRLSEGSATSVEVNRRASWGVPLERIDELRADHDKLLADKRVLTDEQGLRIATREHLTKLLAVEQAEHRDEMSRSRPNAAAWTENLAFLLSGIETAQGQLREVEARLKLLEVEIKAASEDLGQALASKVDLLDVSVEVRATAGARLDIEYLVDKASWWPSYELRTSNDATSIDLVYRARLRQQSGEDWADCALVLSTAQPERGAKGLAPQ
ncbi:MAG TPA: mucoidy inhibitor MuiA family protein, partial [Planctomycetota bacterium]|nr:mucoidy inhibitor MuiA family protein [Planctomycetota bacterium]